MPHTFPVMVVSQRKIEKQWLLICTTFFCTHSGENLADNLALSTSFPYEDEIEHGSTTGRYLANIEIHIDLTFRGRRVSPGARHRLLYNEVGRALEDVDLNRIMETFALIRRTAREDINIGNGLPTTVGEWVVLYATAMMLDHMILTHESPPKLPSLIPIANVYTHLNDSPKAIEAINALAEAVLLNDFDLILDRLASQSPP